MTKITELLDDFKLNQQIEGRKPKYIDMCSWRLKRWNKFMQTGFSVEEVEDIKAIHIKKSITINNNIATLKVFFNYLVDGEFLGELENPMRRIKNLKEEKRVIVTFNDSEVKRIINDVQEETFYNIRDKLILIILFDTGTLIHVDAHLDNVWYGLEVDGLHDMEKSTDVFNVAEKLKIDNFIWPAIGTDTIDNVIYASQQNYSGDPFDFKEWNYTDVRIAPVKELFDKNKHDGLRFWNIEEFLNNMTTEKLEKFIQGKNLILDLDLDYFS